jgi:hypothetical protein
MAFQSLLSTLFVVSVEFTERVKSIQINGLVDGRGGIYEGTSKKSLSKAFTV